MKAVFINGSPRKGWNTHKLMVKASEGAKDAGAEVQFFDLYDLEPFTGCRSCFACKIKGSKTAGACTYPDGLRPVMDAVRDADVIVLGTPIYLGQMSAQLNLLWERLMFTNVSYSSYDRGRKMEKPKRCAMIVTMGATDGQMRQIGYDQQFNYYGQQLGYMMGGRPAEMLYSNDAYQFTDYSKYNISVDRADPVQKKKHLEEEYPKDLEKAYELGRRLCS